MNIKAAKKAMYVQSACITAVSDLTVLHSILFYKLIKDNNNALINKAVLMIV